MRGLPFANRRAAKTLSRGFVLTMAFRANDALEAYVEQCAFAAIAHSLAEGTPTHERQEPNSSLPSTSGNVTLMLTATTALGASTEVRIPFTIVGSEQLHKLAWRANAFGSKRYLTAFALGRTSLSLVIFGCVIRDFPKDLLQSRGQ